MWERDSNESNSLLPQKFRCECSGRTRTRSRARSAPSRSSPSARASRSLRRSMTPQYQARTRSTRGRASPKRCAVSPPTASRLSSRDGLSVGTLKFRARARTRGDKTSVPFYNDNRRSEVRSPRFSRRPLSRAYRPFMGRTRKGRKGSNWRVRSRFPDRAVLGALCPYPDGRRPRGSDFELETIKPSRGKRG
jgi:hypothetical protein